MTVTVRIPRKEILAFFGIVYGLTAIAGGIFLGFTVNPLATAVTLGALGALAFFVMIMSV